MSFIGKLFGSEKALAGIVDGVTKGLDALVYTDEEKANDAAKSRTEARGMIIQWMQSTQGQNLSRRIIALSITGIWLLQYVVAQIVSIFVIFAEEPKRLEGVSTVMREGASDMGPAVMLILAFYFSAPFMGDIAKSFANRNKPI